MLRTRKPLIIIGVLILAIVGVVVFAMTAGRPTYVRIVDANSIPNDVTPAPGADINAVEITKSKDKTSIYASEVALSHLLDGANGTPNMAKDPASALKGPLEDQDQKYVSLGLGGELILKLETALKSGDTLIIHEIGSESGPRAEYYDVYVSRNADGPWTSLGKVAGPHTFTFEDDSSLLP